MNVSGLSKYSDIQLYKILELHLLSVCNFAIIENLDKYLLIYLDVALTTMKSGIFRNQKTAKYVLKYLIWKKGS